MELIGFSHRARNTASLAGGDPNAKRLAELHWYLEPTAALVVRSFGELRDNQEGFAGANTPLATGS